MKILVINPGSTSTKIAVYENETPLLVRNISHTVEELSVYSQVVDQFEFRKNLVLQELEANKIPFDFDAVIGRGGLVKPIPGGVYEVNEAMKRDTVHAMRTHACNLGGLIADKLASSLPNCRAFIADPGVVDELEDIARITGSPLMPKITIWHALNQKAIARRFAREQGTQYEDLDLIICHLGGGISIAVHRHGRAIDANNALEDYVYGSDGVTVQAGNLTVDEVYGKETFYSFDLTEFIRNNFGTSGVKRQKLLMSMTEEASATTFSQVVFTNDPLQERQCRLDVRFKTYNEQ